MTQNFLTTSRHGTIFYFRRRVPDDLREAIGKPYLVRTLATSHRAKAIIMARAYAARTDLLYQSLRTMNKKKSDGIQWDYKVDFDLDATGKVTSIKVDAQPEEQDAVNSAIRTAIESSTNLVTAVAPSSKTKPFGSAISEFLEKSKTKPQTKATYQSKLTFAQEFFGGKDADIFKIDQSEFVKYADHVLNKIPHITTQSHYITTVSGFLNWHRMRNPNLSLLTTKTLMPKRDTPESEDRDAYTLEELGFLFTNACKYRSTSASKFWASVAPVFLGCRIEELSQVHLATDLIKDEEADIWYFTFDAKPDPGGTIRKSMKKLASWRRAPIHPMLIEYGFLDFLQSRLKKGYVRPFLEEWQPRKVESKNGNIIKWSHYISKRGSRELVAISKQHEFDPSHDLGYFHSQRHTFARVLGESGVSKEISEALSGRRYAGADAERYEKLKQNHRRLSAEGIKPGLSKIEKLLGESLLTSRIAGIKNSQANANCVPM